MINKNTIELLEQLSTMTGTGSRKAKEDLLRNNLDSLKEYMDIAFNPYRVFKIQEIKTPQLIHDNITQDLTVIAETLEAKKGLTNEDKDWVYACLNSIEDERQRHWTKLAILKNVKIGVDVKTLNKCGYDIPSFELLLASVNKENSLDGIEYPCFVQPKLDGIRCVYFPHLKQFIGRNGRIIPNLNLHDHFEINTDMILDGELYDHSLKFNDIVSVTSSDEKSIPEGFRFVVFNALTKEEWEKQECTTTYLEQTDIISTIVSTSKNIEAITNYEAKCPEQAMHLHYSFLSKGYEGSMVRNKTSKYQWKRVRINEGVLIKIKPFDLVDAEVTGFYEGTSKYQSMLGGLTVRLENGIMTDIGSGFTDSERQEYWQHKDKLIGKWIVVKYTELTPDNNLRFPIFEGFRDPK